jgi:hypothetical protein
MGFGTAAGADGTESAGPAAPADCLAASGAAQGCGSTGVEAARRAASAAALAEICSGVKVIKASCMQHKWGHAAYLSQSISQWQQR